MRDVPADTDKIFAYPILPIFIRVPPGVKLVVEFTGRRSVPKPVVGFEVEYMTGTP